MKDQFSCSVVSDTLQPHGLQQGERYERKIYLGGDKLLAFADNSLLGSRDCAVAQPPWTINSNMALQLRSKIRLPLIFIPRVAVVKEWKWKPLSRVWLFATPRTIQSMEFSRPEYTGVGSLSLLQGILPTQRSNPGLPHCRWILLPAEPQGKPRIVHLLKLINKCWCIIIN